MSSAGKANCTYNNWDDEFIANLSKLIEPMDCDNNKYLLIPEDLVMWVDCADFEASLNYIPFDTTGNAAPRQYSFNQNPYTGNFINLYKYINAKGIEFDFECYTISDECTKAIFNKGFIKSPTPTIPFVVDTYIDANPDVNVDIELPPVLVPGTILPTIVLPDVELPDIIIPDIIIPDINIPDIIIPDIIIPDIIIPDIIIPDIIIPDYVLPDIIIPDIVIPDIVIPDIIIPDIIIPDIIIPDFIVPDIIIPDIIIPDIIIPDIIIPDIVIPDIHIPDLQMPDIHIPDIVIPDIVIPDIIIPDIVIPDFTIPDITIPDIVIPDIIIPDVVIPDIVIPDIVIPALELPECSIKIPDITIPDITITLPYVEIAPVTVRVPRRTNPPKFKSSKCVEYHGSYTGKDKRKDEIPIYFTLDPSRFMVEGDGIKLEFPEKAKDGKQSRAVNPPGAPDDPKKDLEDCQTVTIKSLGQIRASIDDPTLDFYDKKVFHRGIVGHTIYKPRPNSDKTPVSYAVNVGLLPTHQVIDSRGQQSNASTFTSKDESVKITPQLDSNNFITEMDFSVDLEKSLVVDHSLNQVMVMEPTIIKENEIEKKQYVFKLNPLRFVGWDTSCEGVISISKDGIARILQPQDNKGDYLMYFDNGVMGLYIPKSDYCVFGYKDGKIIEIPIGSCKDN